MRHVSYRCKYKYKLVCFFFFHNCVLVCWAETLFTWARSWPPAVWGVSCMLVWSGGWWYSTTGSTTAEVTHFTYILSHSHTTACEKQLHLAEIMSNSLSSYYKSWLQLSAKPTSQVNTWNYWGRSSSNCMHCAISVSKISQCWLRNNGTNTYQLKKL